ncbi:hypothetical protein ACFXK0_12905 [Nocardia sp. NPDC059177]|uniref:hypothetical protein n=1 Tax=Nocardia sp. NPDC059177 TaxID=3346759 RepID=UPI0036BC3DFA
MSSPEWVSRYRDGQREQVWHELRQLGGVVDAGLAREAQLVCDEMALRARRNIEVIVDRQPVDGHYSNCAVFVSFWAQVTQSNHSGQPSWSTR